MFNLKSFSTLNHTFKGLPILLLSNKSDLIKNKAIKTLLLKRTLTCSNVLQTYRFDQEHNFEKYTRDAVKRWSLHNMVVRDPISPDSPTRPRATYNYMRENIKYSPKKMWYICTLIRGLTVDEAIKQLSFVPSKGAQLAKEMLLEAQENAISKHGFEFKSDMFIGECFTGKGIVIKGVRKHAFYRMGEIRYFYCHFFVKLVEGQPPRPFYPQMNPATGQAKLQKYLDDLKERKVEHSL